VPLRFDSYERSIHFAKHGADFPVPGEVEYELAAERFLLSPVRSGLLECKRNGGDLLRYDTASEEFAVMSRSGVIRTYYKPVPCVVRAVPFCHGEPDNVHYFRKTCSL
jgi:pyocin large subunit-like protein